LQGGVANAGAVVRHGPELHRPSSRHSAQIHRFLRHVRDAGFAGASEPIGFDDHVERLVFVPGDVPLPPYTSWAQRDDALASIARLIRRLHDASAGFDWQDDQWNDELSDTAAHQIDHDIVMCHNDVCMENVVFVDGEATTLLDFEYLAPGRRMFDLAAFARMCVSIDDDESAYKFGWEPSNRAARLRVVADAYGCDTSQRDELLTCLGESIERGGEFVRRRVEAGEPAFIEMWNTMGGSERFDRRRAWWSNAKPAFVAAMLASPT
jgi:aminoglycoside phosphotransferase (APT) family kinase protein